MVAGDNYLGDHATPHGNEGSAGEEAALLNNCYVLYCTRLMRNISAVLGNSSGADEYARAAAAHATAIHARFFNVRTGGYVDTRQGHLILALISGVVPAQLQPRVLATLRYEIEVTQGGHIDTGLTTTYFMYRRLWPERSPVSHILSQIHTYSCRDIHIYNILYIYI